MVGFVIDRSQKAYSALSVALAIRLYYYVRVEFLGKNI